MLSPMNTTGRAIAAGLTLGLAGVAVAPLAAADITPPDDATPAVGMAWDTTRDALWLAGPGVAKGEIVTTDGVALSISAEPVSVQALAFHEGRIWLGDIGDPDGDRDFIVVYRYGDADSGPTNYQAYDFVFPDGAPNATALMISGKGRIYLATDGDDAGIYRAPSEPSRQDMNRLTRVADAPEGVTDGVFLDDGTTMALRTAKGIEYIDAMTWKPTVTDTLIGAPDDESIAAGPADVIYVGGNPVVRETDVPSADRTTDVEATASPSPSPSTSPGADPSANPSASPTATPTATATTDPGPGSSGAAGRRGTLTALIIAGGVALAAGAVTFFYRR